MLFWIAYILIYLTTKIFFPTKVIGRENLPKGKAIYAPNHQTNFDAAIITCGLNRRVYALGKKELFKNKLVGGFLKRVGCIKVDRGAPDIDAVKNVLNVLKKKEKPIIIFPTGTRNSSPDEINEIKNGVAMFSAKTQSPIIPMILAKKPRIFRRNKFIIGKPLDLTKYEGRVANKELYNEISEDLTKGLEELIDKYVEKEGK